MALLMERLDEKEFHFLEGTYEKAITKELLMSQIENVTSSEEYIDLTAKIEIIKNELKRKSWTSKFFLSYKQYVEVMLEFIAAERTSDWNLHLQSVSKMLNLFAATGHGNYAKTARLYLQDMYQLPQTHPQLYAFFKEGRHTCYGENIPAMETLLAFIIYYYINIAPLVVIF